MTAMTNPKVRVILADGTEHEVQTLNVDLVKWDLNRGRHGWPGMDEAPLLSLNYCTWHAMMRLGLIDKCTFDEYLTTVVDITAIPVQDGDGQEVDPTRTAAE